MTFACFCSILRFPADCLPTLCGRRWQAYTSSLSPAVRDKMLAMLQHA